VVGTVEFWLRIADKTNTEKEKLEFAFSKWEIIFTIRWYHSRKQQIIDSLMMFVYPLFHEFVEQQSHVYILEQSSNYLCILNKKKKEEKSIEEKKRFLFKPSCVFASLMNKSWSSFELCVFKHDDFVAIKRSNSPRKQIIPSILTDWKLLSKYKSIWNNRHDFLFLIDNWKIS